MNYCSQCYFFGGCNEERAVPWDSEACDNFFSYADASKKVLEIAEEKSCNTDCARYRQGDCPFFEKDKCPRFRKFLRDLGE